MVCCLDREESPTNLTPEQEARHIVRKIRRHARLLNMHWAELNLKSNEWQTMIDEALEVCSYGILPFLHKFKDPFTSRD